MTCFRATAWLPVEPRGRAVLAGPRFHSPLLLRRRPFFSFGRSMLAPLFRFFRSLPLSSSAPCSPTPFLLARPRSRAKTRWCTKGEKNRGRARPQREREDNGRRRKEKSRSSSSFFLLFPRPPLSLTRPLSSLSPQTTTTSAPKPPPPPPTNHLNRPPPSRPSRTPSRP